MANPPWFNLTFHLLNKITWSSFISTRARLRFLILTGCSITRVLLCLHVAPCELRQKWIILKARQKNVVALNVNLTFKEDVWQRTRNRWTSQNVGVDEKRCFFFNSVTIFILTNAACLLVWFQPNVIRRMKPLVKTGWNISAFGRKVVIVIFIP